MGAIQDQLPKRPSAKLRRFLDKQREQPHKALVRNSLNPSFSLKEVP